MYGRRCARALAPLPAALLLALVGAGCLAEPTLDGMGGMDMDMGHGLGPANWTTDCGDVALVAEAEKCAFAKQCDQEDGMLPYFVIYYCGIYPYGGFLTFLFVLMLGTLGTALFMVLGSTAEDYLSPILTEMSQDLGVPPRFAGVTFLALGNGAPDVSATVAAVRSGDYNLSLGALTGAGMFVNTVVGGCVILSQETTKFRGAMIRDVLAYGLTVVALLVALAAGEISYFSVAVFLGGYAIYVGSVLAADVYHIKVVVPRESQGAALLESAAAAAAATASLPLLDGQSDGDEEEEDEEDGGGGGDGARGAGEAAGPQGGAEEGVESPSQYRRHALAEVASSRSFFVRGGPAVTPRGRAADLDMDFDLDEDLAEDLGGGGALRPAGGGALGLRARADAEWAEVKAGLGEMSVVEKAAWVLELPFTALRLLTVPLVCKEKYSRPQVVASMVGMPLWLLFYMGFLTPLRAVAAASAGAVVSGLAATATVDLVAPEWRMGTPWPVGLILVNVGSFVVAASWVDTIASELVGVLSFLGNWTGVPSGVLGLTVLAWGNSIGDYMSNMQMAKAGMGNMAMTACFAGPVFNMLVGLGFGFWSLLGSSREQSIKVHLDENILIGGVFLLVNCGVLIATGLSHDKTLPRKVGYFLVAWYGIYLAAMVLNLCGLL